ncbi:MAG: ABC transporter permease, partial [Planctomycetota bacterium]
VLRTLMLVNPLTGIIEGCRAAALPGVAIDWLQLGVSAAVTAVLFALGARYFARVERAFADLV